MPIFQYRAFTVFAAENPVSHGDAWQPVPAYGLSRTPRFGSLAAGQMALIPSGADGRALLFASSALSEQMAHHAPKG
jgi:hypothetical protein